MLLCDVYVLRPSETGLNPESLYEIVRAKRLWQPRECVALFKGAVGARATELMRLILALCVALARLAQLALCNTLEIEQPTHFLLPYSLQTTTRDVVGPLLASLRRPLSDHCNTATGEDSAIQLSAA